MQHFFAKLRLTIDNPNDMCASSNFPESYLITIIADHSEEASLSAGGIWVADNFIL